jgi:YD repeat-containing protein
MFSDMIERMQQQRTAGGHEPAPDGGLGRALAGPVAPPRGTAPPEAASPSMPIERWAGMPADADARWRPAPHPDGSLIQDPDFTLPTAAGPLTWRLFHDSSDPTTIGPWGARRRASFPLLLHRSGVPSVVTVMHDDGSDRVYQFSAGAGQYFAQGIQNGDALTLDPRLGEWNETRGENGFRYHFPQGNFVHLDYWATPQDLRITCSYDASGRLQSLLEPAGRRVTLGNYAVIGGGARVGYLQDWGDRRQTFSYNSAGDLTQVVGPTGCITQYSYDSSHRITSITDPEGYTTSYTYDSSGRVFTRSIAGNLGRYTYVRTGPTLATGYKDPLGRTWTHLTSGGYPSGQIDPLGKRQTYVYASDRLQSVKNELGYVTTYSYNSSGLLVGQQDALGNRWTYTRDSFTNIVTEQNPLGYITSYSYGASPQLRQLTTVTNPLGQRTTYGYLSNGLLQSVQDALGNRVTYVWSNLGLLDAAINPLGYRTSYLYDIAGNRIAEIDAIGNRWSYSFDAMGRETSQRSPLGYRTTTIYDARGLAIAEIDATGSRTTYSYNATGDWSEEINALGARTTRIFDAAFQLIAEVDSLGYRTTNLYDPLGRVSASQDARGYQSTIVYDSASRVIDVTSRNSDRVFPDILAALWSPD